MQSSPERLAAIAAVVLAHAEDDPVVPVENSLAMYKALLAADIAAELHIFPQSGHGLHVPGPPNRAWMDLFLPWSNRNGFTTWPKGLP
jgi:dipeptidyl aminopeptidase/acylaminoacyl peptidase